MIVGTMIAVKKVYLNHEDSEVLISTPGSWSMEISLEDPCEDPKEGITTFAYVRIQPERGRERQSMRHI